MGKAQTSPNGVPSVLKRNMACHQCRRRKLKCDAQRPCATCRRSHANQIATAMPGADIPLEPVCTYDELPEPKEPVEKLPGEGGIRAKYERLEARIAELEAQLREKEQLSNLANQSAAFQTMSMRSQLSPLARLTIGDPFDQLNAASNNNNTYPTPYTTTNPTADPALIQQYAATAALRHPGGGLEMFEPMSALSMPGFQVDSHTPSTSTGAGTTGAQQQTTGSPLTQATDGNAFTSMLWPNWPERLPSPPLLNHLVEIFFTCHPHANRLLHRPTFLASLRLPPQHQDFPSLSLLHAICALASLWSPAVEQEAMPDLHNRPAEEIFQEAERRKIREQRAQLGLGASSGNNRGDWFGEVHAKWSREEEEKNATEGTAVFQGLQSIVVLTWYYYAHARWVEVWLYTAKALRYAVPMGLNTTPTHGPLLRSWTMPSILGPPKDAIEAEMRRTTFWLAYCYERWQAASTGWAMGLDDEDISQVLSLPQKDFEQGISLHPELRQRISTPRMLTLHIPEQTDSFTLYVKGTILFSKVKNFNIRFKSKYYYAVASSTTYGDRFGAFGTQSVPRMFTEQGIQEQQQQQHQHQQQQEMMHQARRSQSAGPTTAPGVASGSGTTGGSTNGNGGVSRGPSPDMAPIATLATSGVLQQDDLSETRWHTSSAPAFSPVTTGNPPPGPQGTYGSPITRGPERIDPRDTPSFRAIDGLIEGYRTSFPKNLRDPVQDGAVDSELYVACLVPHVAVILLHDPHADPSAPSCKSAEKLLIAARAILDLVYILCSTSFDITLLDPVASFAWFLAARVFVRFIKARLDGRRQAEAVGLRNELEVIRLALKRMGERVPLGYRQSKMLDDLLANEIGTALDNPTGLSYAFTTTSPDGQDMALPGTASPDSIVHGDLPIYGPRQSFSAQGLAPQESLSLPSPRSGMGSRHNSFSAQGDIMLSSTTGLPLPEDDVTTNRVMLNQLPASFDAVSHSNSVVDDNAIPAPPFNFGVAEIHQKFLESMKSQDEREMGSPHAPVGGGRLEMLLGEMVDDGDGDGIFGGISTMGVMGNGPPPGYGIGMNGPGSSMMPGNEFNAIGVHGW